LNLRDTGHELLASLGREHVLVSWLEQAVPP
jgi:hypothetical protein